MGVSRMTLPRIPASSGGAQWVEYKSKVAGDDEETLPFIE